MNQWILCGLIQVYMESHCQRQTGLLISGHVRTLSLNMSAQQHDLPVRSLGVYRQMGKLINGGVKLRNGFPLSSTKTGQYL